MSESPEGFWSRAHALLYRRKYEFLLVSLLQHLFTAVLFSDLDVYSRLAWPLSTVIIGFFSVGVFAERTAAQRRMKHVTNTLVVVYPALSWIAPPTDGWMIGLSLAYLSFFVVIFVEVLRYLLRPRYINVDLVLAAICGYLLLLETSTFMMQALYYLIPDPFHGIDTTSRGTVYLDLVYFCSIILTSIGLGDITPEHHVTKLATSVVGIIGQIYSVVLVGILISKYASTSQQPTAAPSDRP
jgi:hypothetical protein